MREKDEVAQGMIPTAVNVPLSGFIDSLRASPEEFRKLHGFEKPRKDQEIVFYCRSGKRAATAADSAKDNGFTEYVRLRVDLFSLCLSLSLSLSRVPSVKTYPGSWLEWVKKAQENDYNVD